MDGDELRVVTRSSRLLKVVTTFFGMAGLRIDRPRKQIALTGLLIALSVVASEALVETPRAAAIYVAGVWCVYYAGQIFFFRLGLHHLLREKLGAKRAWPLYETTLGVVFFNQGWSQAELLTHFRGTLVVEMPAGVLLALSVLLVALATITKVWATLVVGLDVYYYRDMFLHRAGAGGLATTGPYSAFSDPMYSIGNFTMYGAALDARSLEGLFVALLFHVSIYVFHYASEKRFVAIIYGPRLPSGRT